MLGANFTFFPITVQAQFKHSSSTVQAHHNSREREREKREKEKREYPRSCSDCALLSTLERSAVMLAAVSIPSAVPVSIVRSAKQTYVIVTGGLTTQRTISRLSESSTSTAKRFAFAFVFVFVFVEINLMCCRLAHNR